MPMAPEGNDINRHLARWKGFPCRPVADNTKTSERFPVELYLKDTAKRNACAWSSEGYGLE